MIPGETVTVTTVEPGTTNVITQQVPVAGTGVTGTGTAGTAGTTAAGTGAAGTDTEQQGLREIQELPELQMTEMQR